MNKDINLGNMSPFTKHIDVKSGRFYYVLNATGEAVWDVPPPCYAEGGLCNLENHNDDTNSTNTIIQEPTNLLRIESPLHDENQNNRERLIKSIQIKYQKKKMQHEKIQTAKCLEKKLDQDKQVDNIWKRACDLGNQTGIVGVNWKNLGSISNRIYDFQSTYNIPLESLSLNGNGLYSLEDITYKCRSLKKLSLSSNLLGTIEDSIENLRQLTHLNLTRNKISFLSYKIGRLENLEVLELADNMLQEIPSSISQLKLVKRLNLECNRLNSLPEEIGQMNCEEINVNSNQITLLPESIGRMKKLQRLLANDNQIKAINICSSSNKKFCSSIQVLHLSKNRIVHVPKTIQRMKNLQSLHLDYNSITELPHEFHQLENLSDFKIIDGNQLLHDPPREIMLKGLQDILNWCKDNILMSNDYDRNLDIIQSMRDVLEDVGKYCIGGLDSKKEPFESVFEDNVVFEGELYYQFLLPVFFSSFVPSPKTRSFPYERNEVELILRNFKCRGIHGMKKMCLLKKRYFRRCCCVDKNGHKRVCIPPQIGWMCERSALLLRKEDP